MNNKIKYSVIIPIYNSEKTIARCLESLTAQKREDVQILAVNDGSKDNSAYSVHLLAVVQCCFVSCMVCCFVVAPHSWRMVDVADRRLG